MNLNRMQKTASVGQAIGAALIALAIALYLMGCANISVKSPDGSSTASYQGTSIFGSEDVSCGSMAGVVTCSVSGQNLSALAQAIVPYLGGIGGIPLPAATPSAAATPAAKVAP